jgi:hypothetical protein
MNENAKKWVEALRSGEYSQSRDMGHAVTYDGNHAPHEGPARAEERHVQPEFPRSAQRLWRHVQAPSWSSPEGLFQS